MSQYSLKHISSTITDRGDLDLRNHENLHTFLGKHEFLEGSAVFYFDHNVSWAKYAKNSIIWAKDNFNSFQSLQNARIFNQTMEIYLWKVSEGIFNYRVRFDGKGSDEDIIEARQILIGKVIGKPQNGFTMLAETSGSTGWVPGEFDNEYVAITTCNYIHYEYDLIAGYYDSRFVYLEGVK